jgi:hypothetical protein
MRKGWLQIPHPGEIPFSRELFLLLPAALLRERYRTAFPRTRAIRFSPEQSPQPVVLIASTGLATSPIP